MTKDERKEGWALIDARGLKCPLPVLRLARAVRDGSFVRVRLIADDPAALLDVPAYCAEEGLFCTVTTGAALPATFEIERI